MIFREIANLAHMNKPILLSLWLLLLLFGCNLDNSKQHSPTSMPRQQPTSSSSPSGKQAINTDLPIEFIRGQQFTANKSLEISAKESLNKIEFSIHLNLGDTILLPKVYNSGFKEYEDADHIELTIKGFTKDSKRFSARKVKEPISSGRVTFLATMDEDDFHSLKTGEDTLHFEVDFKFLSFFGKYAAQKIPVSAKIKVPFEIHPIYESCAYFKSLKLNKEKTLQKLKGEENDFGDGTPEACIFISSNNKTIIYQKNKNSFTLSHKRTEVFFHSDPNPYINIGAYDADYGLNFDDLLGDTLLPLDQLTFPSYQNVLVDCADELKVYFTTKGQINK